MEAPPKSKGEEKAAKDQATHIQNLTRERATEPKSIEIPTISLPKGGGAIKGIDEKFQVNASNGTSSYSIPLPETPGRSNLSPNLSLSYNSGAGNGIFGLGWEVAIPSIKRKTDKQLPTYANGEQEDTFMLGGAEDLVPFLKETTPGNWDKDIRTVNGYEVTRYRPRIEDSFARIEKIRHATKGTWWKVTTGDNTATIYGRSPNARIADPDDATRIYKWCAEFTYDDKGNWIHYQYKQENLDKVGSVAHEKNRLSGLAPIANSYPKHIQYGNTVAYTPDPLKPFDPQLPADKTHLFALVFDYGEHDAAAPLPVPPAANKWDARTDAFSNYNAGFEMRTWRLCERVMLFHHFKNEPGFGENYLVRSLDLEYTPSSINKKGDTEANYLSKLTPKGYIRKSPTSYAHKALPPIEFTYQELVWNKTVRTVDTDSIQHAPAGLSDGYQWADLYGEGISGILSEKGEAIYYKSNLGDPNDSGGMQFSTATQVAPKPSFSGLGTGTLSLEDLESDGQKQLVVNTSEVAGYFELDHQNNWKPFQHFSQQINVDRNDPNLRRIDLTGDGQSELVISEENAFIWYESAGKKGFQSAKKTARSFDEERGPNLIFSEPLQTIFLADMTGDGLSDIVRVRNNEICYWANKGYGHFSAKVTMSNAPLFDTPEAFDPDNIQFGDVSGTGATDIIYTGKKTFKAYINLSGNGWSDAHEIDPFLPIDDMSNIAVIDLLGTGTSCVVWSSGLPAHKDQPLRYIDLMSSKKPHVLKRISNNLGEETTLEYKSSTYYYLKDKREGKPWITKLPFPVQVVSKVVTEEKITGLRFTNEYVYHHGYYDHPEREFRGFGMVEQIDTEDFDTWKANAAGTQLDQSRALFQDPVVTKSWYHTGAYLQKGSILSQFEKEYWGVIYDATFPTAKTTYTEPKLVQERILAAPSIQDPAILSKLSAKETQEAYRACKGIVLREEVFALDAPSTNPSEAERKRELTPYSVALHNCAIQVLQPAGNNQYAVFRINEGESFTIQYERVIDDPRVSHSLNIAFDDLGRVLENAAVVYGRNAAKAAAEFQPYKNNVTSFNGSTEKTKLTNAFNAAMSNAETAQKKEVVLYTLNVPTTDINTDTVFRLREVAEVKHYEITGLAHAARYYTPAEFKDVLLNTVSTSRDYLDPITGGVERRLTEHFKTLYYHDDLINALPLGQQGSKGLVYENYQLAFTPGLISGIYGTKIPTPATTMPLTKMRNLDSDGNWWIRSGITHYLQAGEVASAATPRFLMPMAYSDALGSRTTVTYWRNYFYLIATTTDPVQNKLEALGYNFRVLLPTLVRDENNNLTNVIIDEIGQVKSMALLGKDLDEDGVAELDVRDNLTGLTEVTESEQTAINNYFTLEDSNQLNTAAAGLLKNASTRYVYDMEAFRLRGKPVVASSIMREEHHSDNPNSKLEISFTYSDGTGEEIMTKTQAAPGEALKLTIASDNSYTVATVDTRTLLPPQTRWIGDGRIIFNNKGNPVKEFEPYFSTSPFYEDAKELVELGVTPITHYDAQDRIVKIVYPDQTIQRSEFDAWKMKHFDQNDNLISSKWYTDRFNNAINAELIAAGKDPAKEKEAAVNSQSHNNTPGIVFSDTLGRAMMNIRDNGEDPLEAGKRRYYTVFLNLDFEGNTTSVTDSRGNTPYTYKYDMLGHRLYQNSMDNGERWSLNNGIGKPVRKWDNRQHAFSFTYDDKHRPLEMHVAGGDTPGVVLNHVFEKYLYGEGQTDDKKLNLRDNQYAIYDTAGKQVTESFDLKGNELSSFRQFATDYKKIPHWGIANPDSKLDLPKHRDVNTYDALSRTKSVLTSDGSLTSSFYDEGGALVRVNVTPKTGPQDDYIERIEYNARGDRTSVKYGNGSLTTYQYDKETFRVNNLKTVNGGGATIQDIFYTYDPVGNVTHLEDKCIPEVFFNNTFVKATFKYSFDPLYRLTKATGREHAGQALSFGNTDNYQDLPFLKTYSANDIMVWRNYTQDYAYDPEGNILLMKHTTDWADTSRDWTRTYTYKSNNNQLAKTEIGGKTYPYSHHPTHGYMDSMPHLQVMEWDFKDQLQAVSTQSVTSGTPETTFYVYDSDGVRVRKVTELAAAAGAPLVKKNERMYLGAVEKFFQYTGTFKNLERTSLHVMDGVKRFLIIDTRNGVNDGTDVQTIRYQYSNLVGSATLETNEAGETITYEEYHPYGTTSYQAVSATIKAAAKRYRYTGMERDEETGLNYHTARYYIPWLGRWSSPDPAGAADGLNLYQYVAGNPVTASDPNGNWSWKKIAVVAAVVVVGVAVTVATAGVGTAAVAGAVSAAGLTGTAATAASVTGAVVVAGTAGAAGSVASTATSNKLTGRKDSLKDAAIAGAVTGVVTLGAGAAVGSAARSASSAALASSAAGTAGRTTRAVATVARAAHSPGVVGAATRTAGRAAAGAAGGATGGAVYETTRQVASGEASKKGLDGGKILSAAKSGAVTGAVLNPVMDPAVARITQAHRVQKATAARVKQSKADVARGRQGVGPAVSSSYDPATGKTFPGRNAPAPEPLVPVLQSRVDQFSTRSDAGRSYYGKPGQQHAEITSLNSALRARQSVLKREMTPWDIKQVTTSIRRGSGRNAGKGFRRCPRCEVITDGMKLSPEVKGAEVGSHPRAPASSSSP